MILRLGIFVWMVFASPVACNEARSVDSAPAQAASLSQPESAGADDPMAIFMHQQAALTTALAASATSCEAQSAALRRLLAEHPDGAKAPAPALADRQWEKTVALLMDFCERCPKQARQINFAIHKAAQKERNLRHAP